MADVTRTRARGIVRSGVWGLGVLLLWAGGTVLLYLVWLLWFTGVGTAQAQDELLQEFEGFETVEQTVEPTVDDEPTVTAPETRDQSAVAGASDRDEVELGTGVAVLEFERPGSSTRPVRDQPVVVVEGTSEAALRDGPGHYVSTADPGQEGNFAVAGHRTTYGQPFYHLDEIQPGDLVHVTARDGTRYSYEVLDGSSGDAPPGQHIIRPSETWVLGDDPRDTGGAVLTLTTCHPRFSAAYRLIVFAHLVDTVPS